MKNSSLQNFKGNGVKFSAQWFLGTFGWTSVSYCVSYDWSMVLKGCLPFTTCFRKIRLESKWNKTLWLVLAENFQKQPRSGKVVLFFWTECSYQWRFVFHLFKAIFDTSFRPPRSFFVKWNWFVQMVTAISGRNLPKFAYHLLKHGTDRFAHVNGKRA